MAEQRPTLHPGAAELLADAQIGWLTTMHGMQPQSSPVWFLFADSVVWVRSQPAAAKLRNIAGNPRVSFHLDTTHGGHVVTIEAEAEQVEDFPPEVAKAYRSKYVPVIERHLRSDLAAFERQYSVSLRLTPTRVRGW